MQRVRYRMADINRRHRHHLNRIQNHGRYRQLPLARTLPIPQSPQIRQPSRIIYSCMTANPGSFDSLRSEALESFFYANGQIRHPVLSDKWRHGLAGYTFREVPVAIALPAYGGANDN